MPRPRNCRQIFIQPKTLFYKPQGIPLRDLAIVELHLEELEALRLKNLENLEQTEAAARMNISQSTFQRTLSAAYKKISLALVEGKAIAIQKE
ncbi:MAG: DUF134 domain-containing protein [Patescibacteria group bacterium]